MENHNFTYCFYGCETWTLKPSEELRLRVCDNRVLRRIFGLKRNKFGERLEKTSK
jgi:hypothetical protein